MISHDPLKEQVNVVEVEQLLEKDNKSNKVITRELRITLEPISSVIIAFNAYDNNYERVLELKSNTFVCENDSKVERFRCDRGNSPTYYRGRTVTVVEPRGKIDGKYIQRVDVENLKEGDKFGYRLLNDEIAGATIKLEIFDNDWKTIVHENITKSFRESELNW